MTRDQKVQNAKDLIQNIPLPEEERTSLLDGVDGAEGPILDTILANLELLNLWQKKAEIDAKFIELIQTYDGLMSKTKEQLTEFLEEKKQEQEKTRVEEIKRKLKAQD